MFRLRLPQSWPNAFLATLFAGEKLGKSCAERAKKTFGGVTENTFFWENRVFPRFPAGVLF